MPKLKKVLLITTATIAIIVAVVILFISPIAKYILEKYDERWTGRQIKIDWAYVNPFTGYVYLHNLRIYEQKSDSVFISANYLSGTFSMHKMLSKTYEISECTLSHPKGMVIQNNRTLNFSDVIEKFTPPKGAPKKHRKAVHFSILKIKIIEGEFHYNEVTTPINYFIKNVNIESDGKAWNSDTMGIHFAMLPGTGSGDVKGNMVINFARNDYRLAVVTHKLNLSIIEQYMKDFSNYGSFSANVDANLKWRGNFKDEEDITASGAIAVNDFHFGKTPKDDYASFEKAMIKIDELSPKNHKYLFDSISVRHPYAKYEKYDSLDNIQRMFGKAGANVSAVDGEQAKFNLIIEIARYVKVLVKNFFKSNYRINRLGVYNADVIFNDFSTCEQFSAELDPLTVVADSIDKSKAKVLVSLKSGIKPYGSVRATLTVNPQDSSDFDLQYNFQKIPITIFNPYTITYTSFPLDRGSIELNGTWHVRNGVIQSDNHLIVIDPRVTKRIRKKDTKWIPLPLIMALVRERGNVIDYQIPITGNLKNPKFHLRDVVLDIVKNIFIKPATTPYAIQVKNVETEIEKSLSLKWPMKSSALQSNQEKFIERMADFLENTPAAEIEVTPQEYALKEREYILLFEAKKKYFMALNRKGAPSFSEDDSAIVESMSVKDPSFKKYLDKMVRDTLLFTVQEKCARLIHPAAVNGKLKQLSEARLKTFMIHFKEHGSDKQVIAKKEKDTIPFNGFSFYKISYKGDLPKELEKAYQKMNELNDKAPRKKFKQERKREKNYQ